MEYLVQFIVQYINIVIMVYLFGVILSSFLYVPYKVARNNLKGFRLFLNIIGCFLWPILVPPLSVALPIIYLFKLMVKNFTVVTESKKDKEDERETVPLKLDPKFMNIVSDSKVR